jgi:TolB-like protein
MTLAPATRLGPYEIVAPLGAGGMGEVYRARDSRLGREVAVKVLPAEVATDPERLRRFEQEARAASALSHPNILTLFDVGRHEATSYLVTELLEGESLRERLAHGTMPPRKAIALGVDAARGLAAAHAKGIVHRDLKPENLFLTADGGVKILDFGLAKLTLPESGGMAEATTIPGLTATGMVMGTAGYMAPEQVRGDAADARSDLFALGCVLYEVVAGRRAFAGDTAPETFSAILRDDPPPLAVATPGGGALESIVRRCLEKRPDDRFQSARDLGFALESLGAAPHPAAGASVATGTSAARRRALATAGLLAALAVALAAGIAIAPRRERGAPAAPSADARTVKSLAVLPLEEFGAKGERYFGIGVADTIQTKLGAIDALVVRPTSAVRKFVGAAVDPLAAARELGVEAVLAGSVQRADGRLRLNVRLLGADGESLWAETFDGGEGEIFAIQDRVAEGVLTHLRIRLDQARRLAIQPTRDPAAYDAYLRGLVALDRRITDPDSVRSAIARFEEALRLDPASALAWAQLALAEAWMGLFHQVDRPEWTDRARKSLARSRELDPRLAEPHVVESEIRFSPAGGWDPAGAVRALLEAQRLDPRAGLGELADLYAHLGLDERALATARHALEIDPSSAATQERYVSVLSLSGAWSESVDFGPRLVDRRWWMIPPLLWLDRIEEANALARSVRSEFPDSELGLAQSALVAARRGRTAEALAGAAELETWLERRRRSFHHRAHDLAAIHALASDAAGATRWLDEMAATGLPNLPLVERDKHLDGIRNSPEYLAFVARLRPVWQRNLRELG